MEPEASLNPSPQPALRCAVSDEQAQGWRAIFAEGLEGPGDENDVVAVFCPECAAREFGD
jgi:hypothetical protein